LNKCNNSLIHVVSKVCQNDKQAVGPYTGMSGCTVT